MARLIVKKSLFLKNMAILYYLLNCTLAKLKLKVAKHASHSVFHTICIHQKFHLQL